MYELIVVQRWTGRAFASGVDARVTRPGCACLSLGALYARILERIIDTALVLRVAWKIRVSLVECKTRGGSLGSRVDRDLRVIFVQ